MTVTIKGHSTLTGRPETIIQLMSEASFFDDRSGDDYIENVKSTAWRCFGIPLQVTGDTHPERAESLLRALHKNGMITIEEE